MFDEEDYISDEEENVMFSHKSPSGSRVLAPSTGAEFNSMVGEN